MTVIYQKTGNVKSHWFLRCSVAFCLESRSYRQCHGRHETQLEEGGGVQRKVQRVYSNERHPIIYLLNT